MGLAQRGDREPDAEQVIGAEMQVHRHGRMLPPDTEFGCSRKTTGRHRGPAVCGHALAFRARAVGPPPRLPRYGRRRRRTTGRTGPPGRLSRRLRGPRVPFRLRGASAVVARRGRLRDRAVRPRLPAHRLAVAERPDLCAGAAAVRRRRDTAVGGRRPVPGPAGAGRLRCAVCAGGGGDGGAGHPGRGAAGAALCARGHRAGLRRDPGRDAGGDPRRGGAVRPGALGDPHREPERTARRVRRGRSAARRGVTGGGARAHRRYVPRVGAAAAAGDPGAAGAGRGTGSGARGAAGGLAGRDPAAAGRPPGAGAAAADLAAMRRSS